MWGQAAKGEGEEHWTGKTWGACPGATGGGRRAVENLTLPQDEAKSGGIGAKNTHHKKHRSEQDKLQDQVGPLWLCPLCSLQYAGQSGANVAKWTQVHAGDINNLEFFQGSFDVAAQLTWLHQQAWASREWYWQKLIIETKFSFRQFLLLWIISWICWFPVRFLIMTRSAERF